jgi:hypothetical protein
MQMMSVPRRRQTCPDGWSKCSRAYRAMTRAAKTPATPLRLATVLGMAAPVLKRIIS